MSEEILIKEVEVSKLRLRPGDVLVVHLPKDTRHSWMQKLAMHLHKVLPRNPALLVAEDVTLSVVSPEDAQAILDKAKKAQDGTEV